MATAAASRLSGPVLQIPSYRSASPTRVKLASAGGSGARSPGKSFCVSSLSSATTSAKSCRSCMCSPTNHPGSFRCSRHKEPKSVPGSHSKPASPPSPPASLGSGVSSGTCRLGSKRMDSTLVRVGGAVESGTWARRALAPPPQSQNRRRGAAGRSFRPRPSRLFAVSFAGDRAGDNRQ